MIGIAATASAARAATMSAFTLVIVTDGAGRHTAHQSSVAIRNARFEQVTASFLHRPWKVAELVHQATDTLLNAVLDGEHLRRTFDSAELLKAASNRLTTSSDRWSSCHQLQISQTGLRQFQP